MFTELSIQNFQSLEDVDLKLGKVNVIIGPSFLGKSAVVRAIYSLVRNRFESSFLRKGAQSACVTLSEGDAFVKYKRDPGPSYILSGKAEPFIKIGREIPSDIKDALNMNEIIFDNDLVLDFNFQRQFDAPFILSLSGFEVAKVFGKLMDLDIVLASSKDIYKEVQALNKKKDLCLALEDSAIDYIQKHCSIEVKYSLLNEALSLSAKYDETLQEADALLDLIAEYLYQEECIRVFTEVLNLLGSYCLDSLEEKLSSVETLLVDYLYNSSISEMIKPLVSTSIDFDVVKLQNVQDLLVDTIYANSIIFKYKDLVKPFDDIFDTLSKLKENISEGDTLNSTYGGLKKELASVENDIKANRDAFKSYIKDHNICPFTGQIFAARCIQSLEENYK